jgi:hypothetical protein
MVYQRVDITRAARSSDCRILRRPVVLYRYQGDMVDLICESTGIDTFCLLSGMYEIKKRSVACKMSWLSRRETTRTEDMAYCMLGIFDRNMAPLYEEGHKAFHRLQEEIIRISHDQTIFAWRPSLVADYPPDARPRSDLIAPIPAAFAHSGEIEVMHGDLEHYAPYAITNTGLEGYWHMLPHKWDPDRKSIILAARAWDQGTGECYRLAVPIMKSITTGSWVRNFREEDFKLISIGEISAQPRKLEKITISDRTQRLEYVSWSAGSSLATNTKSSCDVSLSSPNFDTWRMLVLDGEYDNVKGVVKMVPTETNTLYVRSWVAVVAIFTTCPDDGDTWCNQGILHFELIDREEGHRLYCSPLQPYTFQSSIRDIPRSRDGCTPSEHQRLKAKCKLISQQLQASIRDDDSIVQAIHYTIHSTRWTIDVIRLDAKRNEFPNMPPDSISCVVEHYLSHRYT